MNWQVSESDACVLGEAFFQIACERLCSRSSRYLSVVRKCDEETLRIARAISQLVGFADVLCRKHGILDGPRPLTRSIRNPLVPAARLGSFLDISIKTSVCESNAGRREHAVNSGGSREKGCIGKATVWPRAAQYVLGVRALLL
jgi:hypothetical protein